MNVIFFFLIKHEQFQSNNSHFAAQSGVNPEYLVSLLPSGLFPARVWL